jgi:hypothetical protein
MFWMFFKFIIFSHTITVCNTSDLTRAEPNLGTAQTPSPLDFPFNCSEIKKGIKWLKNSKKEGRRTTDVLNVF